MFGLKIFGKKNTCHGYDRTSQFLYFMGLASSISKFFWVSVFIAIALVLTFFAYSHFQKSEAESHEVIRTKEHTLIPRDVFKSQEYFPKVPGKEPALPGWVRVYCDKLLCDVITYDSSNVAKDSYQIDAELYEKSRSPWKNLGCKATGGDSQAAEYSCPDGRVWQVAKVSNPD